MFQKLIYPCNDIKKAKIETREAISMVNVIIRQEVQLQEQGAQTYSNKI